MKRLPSLLCAAVGFSLLSCSPAIQDRLALEPEASSAWTVLYYADADNSLDSYILADMAELKAGLSADADINVILLVDRASDATSIAAFGEAFSDTRLYRLLDGAFVRLDGGDYLPHITTSSDWEGNMGDAGTLKAFVDYGKKRYPATHYALFLSNHGGGARGGGTSSQLITRQICVDDSSTDASGDSDALYTAEITDVLGSAESVDLLVFDACFMGTVEVAYQYRPKTDGFGASYFAASAPSVWGYGLPYDKIFERLRPLSGNNGETDTTLTAALGSTSKESYYSPESLTAEEFGLVIVEEQRDITVSSNSKKQSFFLIDLSDIAAVKTAIDSAVSTTIKATLETYRNSSDTSISYRDTSISDNFTDSDSWYLYPYIDLWDLSNRASLTTLRDAVNACTLYSFGGSSYSGFTANQNGLSIFFPDGDSSYSSSRYWAYQWWYSPADTAAVLGSGYLYGKLDWCIYAGTDATICNNSGTVENWFELLDSWYDTTNDTTGGLNGVRY